MDRRLCDGDCFVADDEVGDEVEEEDALPVSPLQWATTISEATDDPVGLITVPTHGSASSLCISNRRAY